MQALRDSSAVAGDTDELRRRMEDDGYLYLRNFVPAAGLARLCADVEAVAARAGWFVAAGAPRQATPGLYLSYAHPAFRQVFDAVYHLESFHALPHAPEVVRFFERFLGAPVLLNPNHAIRMVFPVAHAGAGPHATTRPHQDFATIQGCTATYTTWTPLHDCPPDSGPLLVARGSHRHGLLPLDQAGQSGTVLRQFEDDWCGGSIAAGDVIIFHSLTIHQALPNHSGGVRLSMDFRYQRLDDPIDAFALGKISVATGIPWETIYRGFDRATPRNYWEGLMVCTNAGAATTLAEARNAPPRRPLRNLLDLVAAHSSDTERREQAQRLLDQKKTRT